MVDAAPTFAGVVLGRDPVPPMGKCRTLVGMVTTGLFWELSVWETRSPAPRKPESGEDAAGLRGCKGLRGAGPAGVRGGQGLKQAEQPGWSGAKSSGEGAAF